MAKLEDRWQGFILNFFSWGVKNTCISDYAGFHTCFFFGGGGGGGGGVNLGELSIL